MNMGYRAKPNKKEKYSQGAYNLINPSKYLGDPSVIYFRSSWEYKLYYETFLRKRMQQSGSALLF